MTAMVCRLTDEELDALTDGSPTPVGSPYLEQLDPGGRAVARRTAQRSLMVRRLLEPAGELRPDLVHGSERGGTVPGRATGLVRVVLDMRAGAPLVAVLHRWTGAPRDAPPGGDEPTALSRYVHVVEDVLVTEDVTATGVHTFGLHGYADLATVFREFLVPPDACGTVPGPPGREFTDPGDADRLLGALRRPTVLAESVVLHALGGGAAGPPEPRTLALGPHGCFAGTPTPAGTRYRELDVNALLTDLVAEVHAAREAVDAAREAGAGPTREAVGG